MVADAEQCMHEAAVADVDLGRLDQALPDVAVPGSKSADKQQVHEQVQVGGHRLAIHCKCTGQYCGIEESALLV